MRRVPPKIRNGNFNFRESFVYVITLRVSVYKENVTREQLHRLFNTFRKPGGPGLDTVKFGSDRLKVSANSELPETPFDYRY